jgi:hypothetical protein
MWERPISQRKIFGAAENLCFFAVLKSDSHRRLRRLGGGHSDHRSASSAPTVFVAERETHGLLRVISTRDLAETVYNGRHSRMERDLAFLREKGLVTIDSVNARRCRVYDAQHLKKDAQATTPLLFVDVKHMDRYGGAVASWGKGMREMVSHRRHEFDRRLAVWLREEAVDRNDMANALTDTTKPFQAEQVSSVCTVGDGSWNGLNIRPPMMYLDESYTLGVMGIEAGKPKGVLFCLITSPSADDNKPEVVTLESLIEAIRGSCRKGTPFVLEFATDPRDPFYNTLTSTISAYEADE